MKRKRILISSTHHPAYPEIPPFPLSYLSCYPFYPVHLPPKTLEHKRCLLTANTTNH